MKIINIRQIFKLIRENKIQSLIYISGTALAITMVMTLQLVDQIQFANLPTEPFRDRTLYFHGQSVHRIIDGKREQSWGVPSAPEFIKECLEPIESVELVASATTAEGCIVSTQDGDKEMDGTYKATDANFFSLFHLHFIEGASFTQQDFESALPKVVISERIARGLFYAESGIVGSVIRIDFKEYTVCGVVRSVSALSTFASADMWLPYSIAGINKIKPVSDSGHTYGKLSCYLLASSSDDFDKIQAEFTTLLTRYNSKLLNGWTLVPEENELSNHFMSNRKGHNNYTRERWNYILYNLLLLLIPAVNLSGLTIAVMKKRMSEMGLRKAFGATKWHIMKQVVGENMILTLIGGVLGFILSYFVVNMMSGFIFDRLPYIEYSAEMLRNVNLSMFLQPAIFLYAFFYCIVINLLSSAIPAFIVSRREIVDSLHS